MPDNNIARAIVKQLGRPILSASLPGENVEEYTDPEVIEEIFGKRVDLVIDGGTGGIRPSTIIDFSKGEAEVVREGLGVW